MKAAVIVIRILTGLLFLFSSVVVLFSLIPQPEMHGDVKLFNVGMAASGYLMPLLKVTELVCAIALLTNRFVPLATVVLFPITLNILLFHAFLALEGLPIALFLFLSNVFLAYTHRKNLLPLLMPR